eukprot:338613-Prymnesium_polylepis.2
MSVLTSYMRTKKVDPKVARKVIEFYYYGYSCGASLKQIIASTTLPRMPSELLAETHLHLHRGLIQKCPIFDVAKLNLRTVLNLLYKLVPMIGVPGQQVVRQNQPNFNLFIIERGSVRVWKDYHDPNKRVALRTLGDADFFGERSILGAWEKGEASDTATATCECLGFCDLLTLSVDQFVRTIEREGTSREAVRQIWKSVAYKRDMKKKQSRRN